MSTRDTLLVTGASGLLGAKLLRRALDSYHVVALSLKPPSSLPSNAFEFHQIDICDGDAIGWLAAQVRPRAIVHAAAMTDVDACEVRPQEAWEVNVRGTENVARAGRNTGAHLVFLSTDYVFSGDSGPYAEDSPPQPLSVYGRTKLAAEELVAQWCPDACIARTSTLYGYALGTRPNFVTWIVGELRAGKAVTAVTDQISSPTLADNLAEMVLAMVTKRAHGVYHTAGAEWLSRYDFALHIARAFGLDEGLVHPGTTESLKQAAPRPRHSGLITSRAAKELEVCPLSVAEGLRIMRCQQETYGQ